MHGMASHKALLLAIRWSREPCCPTNSRGDATVVKKFTSISDPNTIQMSTPVSEVSGITSFGDIAPSVDSTTQPSSDAMVAHSDAGYQPEPIPSALGYNFRVDSFTWAYTNAIGTVVHSTSFPAVLKAIPNIAMKLAENRFMCADIEVKLKIASTPFHFGSLGVAFIPRNTPSTLSAHTSPYQYQSYPNVTWLRIGAVENLDITLERIPFTTFDYVSGTDPTVGTLVYFVRAPLRSSGTSDEPTPLTVNVFANFKLSTMKLAGRGESNASMRLIKSIIPKLNKKDHPRKQSGKGKRTPEKEAEQKSEQGIISTVLQAAGAFAPLLMESPLAEVAPFAFAAGALAPVFKSLGLSKPLDVSNPTPFIPGQRRYMHQGSGLAPHQRLGQHQDSALADVKECGLGRPDIRELAKQPAWLGTYFFDDSFPSEYVLRVLPLVPSVSFRANASSDVYAPGLMAYYSQFFAFWRGGFKVMIDFDCSQFTSATIAIVHNTYYEVTADMEDVRGNRVNQVVEVRGNTRWKKSFPYISYKAWSPVIGFRSANTSPLAVDDFLDSLEISIINPAKSTADNGDSSIFYSIYIAAADDIDFKDYVGFKLRPAENEIVTSVKKQSLHEEFASGFLPIIPAVKGLEFGYVKSDTQTNLAELCHQEVTTTVEEFNYPMWFWLTNGTGKDTIHMLLFPFLAFRGSINYRVMYTPAPSFAIREFFDGTQVSSWMADYPNLTDPVVVRAEPPPSSTAQPDLCFSFPYTAETAALPRTSGSGPACAEDIRTYDPWIVIGGTESGTAFFRSLGDDLQVGMPFVAPLFTIADPPPVTDKPSDKGKSVLRTGNKSVDPPKETVHGSSSPSVSSSGGQAPATWLELLAAAKK